MKLMQKAEWVLKPHVISAGKGEAKVNLFKNPSGYSIPVVHATKDMVQLHLKGIDIGDGFSSEVFHPGEKKPVIISAQTKGDAYSLNVPVKIKCAMVHLRKF